MFSKKKDFLIKCVYKCIEKENMIEELEIKGTIHCAPTKKQEYRKRKIQDKKLVKPKLHCCHHRQ